MQGICQTCRWWDTSVAAAVDQSLSPCKALPPVVQINIGRGVWPMVDAEDWCGRHTPSAQPTDEAAPATWPIELTPEEEKTAKLWKPRDVANIVRGVCTTCEQSEKDCACIPF